MNDTYDVNRAIEATESLARAGDNWRRVIKEGLDQTQAREQYKRALAEWHRTRRP